MMGTDIAVEEAVIVGLQIEMEICVDPAHFQGDVFTALMMVFITGDQCNGDLPDPAQLHLRADRLRQPACRRRAGRRRRRIRHPGAVHPDGRALGRRGDAGLPHASDGWRSRAATTTRTIWTTACSQSHGRRQMSACTAPATGSLAAAAGPARRHPSPSPTGPRWPRSPTGSGGTRPSMPACWRRCPDRAIRPGARWPLRTRDTADFSIALIDAWAVALDILTFYQERSPTRPSCAPPSTNAPCSSSPPSSATSLAWRGRVGRPRLHAVDAPGSPDVVPIPAGTRVQSVPGARPDAA